MKTNQYIQKYNLDNPDLMEQDSYDYKGLLADLGLEFSSRFEIQQQICKKLGVPFSYDKFLHLVKEMKQKVDCISNKKVGKPFPDNFFSKFFAMYVIPVRQNYFPAEHAQAQITREKIQKKQELLELMQNPPK